MAWLFESTLSAPCDFPIYRSRDIDLRRCGTMNNSPSNSHITASYKLRAPKMTLFFSNGFSHSQFNINIIYMCIKVNWSITNIQLEVFFTNVFKKVNKHSPFCWVNMHLVFVMGYTRLRIPDSSTCLHTSNISIS